MALVRVLARLARGSEQGWLAVRARWPGTARSKCTRARRERDCAQWLKTRLLSAELAGNAKTAAKSQLAAVKTLACRRPSEDPDPPPEAYDGPSRDDPDAAARSAPRQRRVSAIFGQPRNACLPPTGTARPAGQPAATRASRRGSAGLHPQPAETNLLRLTPRPTSTYVEAMEAAAKAAAAAADTPRSPQTRAAPSRRPAAPRPSGSALLVGGLPY